MSDPKSFKYMDEAKRVEVSLDDQHGLTRHVAACLLQGPPVTPISCKFKWLSI